MGVQRREVLRLMAGAAISAAATRVKGFGYQGAEPIQMPTYVILNGTFGLWFKTDRLLCFLPDNAGHKYRLDKNDLTTTGPRSLTLESVQGSGIKAPSLYQAGPNMYTPGSDGFAFDPTMPNHLEIELKYPKEIYAHRLLDIQFSQRSTKKPPKNRIAGALILEYESGPPPTIPRLPGYIPDQRRGYYQVLVAAYNPDLNIDPLCHARMAWSALTSHFRSMDLRLESTKDSKPEARANPASINDRYVEDESVASMPSLRGIKPRMDSKMVAHAANCKSPAFIVTS